MVCTYVARMFNFSSDFVDRLQGCRWSRDQCGSQRGSKDSGKLPQLSTGKDGVSLPEKRKTLGGAG